MPEPLRITVVLGSVTPPGRLHRALSDAVERARNPSRPPGAPIELIDLAEQRIALADGRPPEALDDDTARVVAAIAGADAVVLATPVYRGSLTGALKNLLDHVPVPALRGTPVGIVAMGGSDHHYLGVRRRRAGRASGGRARRAVRRGQRAGAGAARRAVARSRAARLALLALASPTAPRAPQQPAPRRRAGTQLEIAVDVGHVAPQPPHPGRLVGDQR